VAASDWIAGSELAVTIGGVDYPFKTVKYAMKSKMINRANSKYSPGFAINKAGILSLTFSANGPYKQGEIPLAIGGEYEWYFSPASSHAGFPFLGVVESLEFDDDVEDGPSLAITVQNSEDFGVDIT
jgi:hypothetical protein